MVTIEDKNALNQIKNGIWLYFWLLIFEGALRKWILPNLAEPILIIRDPVAIWLLAKAHSRGLMKGNAFITTIVAVNLISFAATLAVGHQNLAVAFYGLRIFLLHFPLIFLIGDVFNHEDVVKIGKVVVWLTPPMAVLIAIQFYSPQSAWINRGVGGDEAGAGFSGALGYFRPPATFSFITGTALFFSLAGVFILYFWFNLSLVTKWLLIAATVGWVASIPLSISRTLFFQMTITVLFLLIAVFRNPKYLARSFMFIIAIGLFLAILASFPFFQTAISAFTVRYTTANETEGGVENVFLDRFLGGMIYALQNSYNEPFLGLGLGYGTIVGSKLLTGGRTFLVSEEEWARMIGESGPLIGLVMIFVRVGVSFLAARLSFRAISKGGDMLAWMLLSVGFFNIAEGQWGPPNILGFSVLIGGLIFACVKKQNEFA